MKTETATNAISIAKQCHPLYSFPLALQICMAKRKVNQMDDAERKRIETEFLAGIVNELENNPDFERQYREMVPDLRNRMAAILDRFKEPRDSVEEDIVYLATRELAFLASPQFRDDVIANRTN